MVRMDAPSKKRPGVDLIVTKAPVGENTYNTSKGDRIILTRASFESGEYKLVKGV